MNEDLNNDVIIDVGNMPKSKDICEKYRLSAPQLKYYRDFFHIEVIEQMQGDKPILYYPPAGVQRLDQIFSLKRSGIKSLHVIKQKLGIKDNENSLIKIDTNDNKMISESKIIDLVKDTESVINDKFNYIIESLSDSLKYFGEEVKDNKSLNEKINELIEEVTEYKTSLREKEDYIMQLEKNHESLINNLKSRIESDANHYSFVYEKLETSKLSEINYKNTEIKNLSERLKIKGLKINDLENEIIGLKEVSQRKDIEIERLKNLVAPWNRKKI